MRTAGAGRKPWTGVGGIDSSKASAASSHAVGYRVFASGSAWRLPRRLGRAV